MNRTGSLIAKWLGGLLVLMIPYILVCGYWAPRGVQFLNPAVCDRGMHIDNHGIRTSATGESPIELTCRSRGGLVVPALKRMLGVAAAFLLAGVAMFALSRRIAPHLTGPRHLQPGRH